MLHFEERRKNKKSLKQNLHENLLFNDILLLKAQTVTFVGIEIGPKIKFSLNSFLTRFKLR